MASRARTGTIVGLVGLVAVIVGGGAYAWRVAQPVQGKIRGKILRIDLPTRTAVLKYVHPRTGKTYELNGEVSPDCDIRIDDRPARLEDLRVGDVVEAEGLVYRTGRVIARRAFVTRVPAPATSQSAPATTTRPSRKHETEP